MARTVNRVDRVDKVDGIDKDDRDDRGDSILVSSGLVPSFSPSLP